MCQKKLSNDEILNLLSKTVVELMQERGREGPYYVDFDVPGTDHKARLNLSKETRMGRDSWSLSVGVHQIGGDRLHSHFLCHGDGQEGKDKVLAYLARPEAAMELAASVKELSHHVEQDD